MGAGIAVRFKSQWPAMYAEYRRRCADGRFAPGEGFAWEEGGVTVFNLATERHWRSLSRASQVVPEFVET